MKTSEQNIDLRELSFQSPKVILHRLNIKETDIILVRNYKIYIHKMGNTEQHKIRTRNLLVKGEKSFLEYQTKENSNIAFGFPMKYSPVFNKVKTQNTKIQTSDSNRGSDFHCTPLRQINGNAIHSSSYLKKPIKQPNSNYCRTLRFSSLNKRFPARNISFKNNINVFKKSNESIQNRLSFRGKTCNRHPNGFNFNYGTRSNGTNHSNNFDGGHTVRNRSRKLSTNCKVVLERIDAKICFMTCLGLKPTLKTDLKKIEELALLRKFKIRGCNVVLSKAQVEVRRKH